MKKLAFILMMSLTILLAACGANEEVIAELEATADSLDLFEDGLTVDIVLPVSLDGATLTWESGNQTALSNNGEVTRPSYGDSDATFDVVLTLTKEDETIERTYSVTVLAESEIPTEVLLETTRGSFKYDHFI